MATLGRAPSPVPVTGVGIEDGSVGTADLGNGAVTTDKLADSAVTAAKINGLTSTIAELNYVDGVTSNVQTQLDAKLESVDISTYTGDVDITGELVVDSYNESYAALSGTTPTVDCESGNVFALSTTGNTTFTFSNPPASGTAYGFTLKLTAGGTHTITYPASVDWAGATAPDAPASGETDVLVFMTHDGGTTWYGALAIDAAG